MDFKDKKRWDDCIEFLKSCKGKKVHVIHDFDLDGVSGGYILYHTLTRLGCEVTTSTYPGRKMPLSHRELSKVKPLNPDVIIINDQDPKSYYLYEGYREIFPDTPTLIIDHHFVVEYDDALFVHPEVVFGVSGSKYCSAKFIYDICSELMDIEDLGWLAVAGLMGDVNTKEFPQFIHEVAEYEGVEVGDDIYKSKFGVISDGVDSAVSVSPEEFFKHIGNLKEIETFQQAIHLGNPYPEVIDEINEYLDRGIELGETHGAVIFLEVESKYTIASQVTTLLSLQYPDRVFVGYRLQTDGYALNIRHQNSVVHTGHIIREVAESLGGTGGGHAPASGGFMHREKWDEFKEKFSERINKELSSTS